MIGRDETLHLLLFGTLRHSPFQDTMSGAIGWEWMDQGMRVA